jgi:multidrug resistance efflux pump
VIASTKAVDVQQILGTVSEFPQLRATAEETMKKLHEEQQKRIKVASDAVNKAEADLLTITQTWKAARDEGASIRSALALDVAKATVAMEQAEAALSAAQYPVRYIKAEKELLIKDLDYATHSDKRFHNELYRLVTKPTALSGRIIPFTEEGKV